MKFTYKAYEDLIKLLLENGYTVCGYDDYQNHDKCVILRHDVDDGHDLGKTHRLAEIENNLGVKSTYFVLLSTDAYNVASAKSIGKINKIISLGHNIGLHFDETKYTRADIVAAVEKEAAILSAILGMPISSVSMHIPSKETLEADYKFNGLINSYSQTFFKEFKYLSDSRRHWREPVIDIIKSNEYKRLHILTHAFWYSDIEMTPSEIFMEYIQAAKYERYVHCRDNTRNFDEFVKEEDV